MKTGRQAMVNSATAGERTVIIVRDPLTRKTVSVERFVTCVQFLVNHTGMQLVLEGEIHEGQVAFIVGAGKTVAGIAPGWWGFGLDGKVYELDVRTIKQEECASKSARVLVRIIRVAETQDVVPNRPGVVVQLHFLWALRSADPVKVREMVVTELGRAAIRMEKGNR